MSDLISRAAAIDALGEKPLAWMESEYAQGLQNQWVWDVNALKALPSVQPTINGYDIRQLELIADVLQKENLPPERVTEALADIGKIVTIVTEEFEEALRKAVSK